MALERFVKNRLDRRRFLESSARNAAGVAAGMVGLAAGQAEASPNELVRIGVIGIRSQGKNLATTFAGLSNVQVAAICDVDASLLPAVAAEVGERQGQPPETESDFRRLLDDPSIDGIVIATPDHWHANMTVAACEAGKDVYVESPLSHKVIEGDSVLDTAKTTQRVIQCGLQQRSAEHFQSATEFVRRGKLGTVRLARAWASHSRKPLPQTRRRKPQGVNYDMWLGPAPERPFAAMRFHHNWRWFWDYGSGELGNWGIHMLDVARWGLDLELPRRVSASGGCYHFNDGRETPDTLVVNFDYDDTTIVWEHRQWTSRPIEGRSTGVAFYGDAGTLLVDRSGWKVYDSEFEEAHDATASLAAHCEDFISAIRTRSKPACDVETAHLSGTLCHLGNIAVRTGTDVEFCSTEKSCGENPAANALLSRESRSPWSLG